MPDLEQLLGPISQDVPSQNGGGISDEQLGQILRQGSGAGSSTPRNAQFNSFANQLSLGLTDRLSAASAAGIGQAANFINGKDTLPASYSYYRDRQNQAKSSDLQNYPGSVQQGRVTGDVAGSLIPFLGEERAMGALVRSAPEMSALTEGVGRFGARTTASGVIGGLQSAAATPAGGDQVGNFTSALTSPTNLIAGGAGALGDYLYPIGAESINGIRTTKGALNDDPVQIYREQQLANTSQGKKFYQGQVQDIANKYPETFGNPSEANIGTDFTNNIKDQYAADKSIAGPGGSNYQSLDAMQKNITLPAESAANIGTGMRSYMSGTGMDVYGGGGIDSTLGRLEAKGINDKATGMDFVTGKPTVSGNGVSLNDIGGLRQSIMDTSPTSAAAQQHAKALDDMVYNEIKSVHGDTVADQYKNLSDTARSQYADFMSTYKDNPVTAKIIDGSVTPAKVIDTIYKSSDPSIVDGLLKFAPPGSNNEYLLKQALNSKIEQAGMKSGEFDPRDAANELEKWVGTPAMKADGMPATYPDGSPIYKGGKLEALNDSSGNNKLFSQLELRELQDKAATLSKVAGPDALGGKAEPNIASIILNTPGIRHIAGGLNNNIASSRAFGNSTILGQPVSYTTNSILGSLGTATGDINSRLNNKPALSQ